MSANEEMMDFTIECEDILLVEYRPEDLDDFHALTWQPEIYQFLPGWNVSKDQRKDWFINYEIPDNKHFLKTVAEGTSIGELRLRLGIILKETGEFIGWCTTGIKEELPQPNREIVYAVSKHHTGKGFAAQAAQGLITYLFQHTDVEILNAIALIGNFASNRVIQKCGFEKAGNVEIDNELFHHYQLKKSSWRGQQ